jgi:hypothetical protein
METLTSLWAAMSASRQRRRRREQLRRELSEYRTSAERHDLQAILYRYDMTVDDLLADREPPVTPSHLSPDRAREEDAWDEIVLDLSSDE